MTVYEDTKDCPGREIAVSIWETETLIIRLIAVLFVFALLRISGRGKETGRETVLYLFVITASATVNLLRSGGGGFLTTLIGAMVAFAVSAPLVARGRAASRDIVSTVAAGSLLGPLGGLAAVAIATMIYIVQRSPGRQPVPMDRFVPRFADSGAVLKPFGRSVLAMIENRRLRRDPGKSRDSAAVTDRDTDALRQAGIEMMPWRTSLAVATLAVMMTGLFI